MESLLILATLAMLIISCYASHDCATMYMTILKPDKITPENQKLLAISAQLINMTPMTNEPRATAIHNMIHDS